MHFKKPVGAGFHNECSHWMIIILFKLTVDIELRGAIHTRVEFFDAPSYKSVYSKT